MKEYAIIYCIQVLLDSVYRDMYKIYIGNKIRNLTRFFDDSYYIASHKTFTIFWGYVKNTRSALKMAHKKKSNCERESRAKNGNTTSSI